MMRRKILNKIKCSVRVVARRFMAVSIFLCIFRGLAVARIGFYDENHRRSQVSDLKVERRSYREGQLRKALKCYAQFSTL